MEQNTAHRAADTITQLLIAHVSDQAEPVDVMQALAVRDDLREISEESTDDYTLPSVGDVLVDADSNSRYGLGNVRITAVYPDSTATDFEIDSDDPWRRTVADYNPSCDENAPVVGAVYIDGSDKVYHFPVDRLESAD